MIELCDHTGPPLVFHVKRWYPTSYLLAEGGSRMGGLNLTKVLNSKLPEKVQTFVLREIESIHTFLADTSSDQHLMWKILDHIVNLGLN